MTGIRVERSAGFIIFYEHGDGGEWTPDRLYLVLRYGAGHWDFPKGHIEEGEEPLTAALRELEEETGIKRDDVDIIPGFKHRLSYMYRDKWGNGRLVKKIVDFFLARSKVLDVHLSFEHTDYEWLEYERARERLTFPTAKQALDHAHQFLGGQLRLDVEDAQDH